MFAPGFLRGASGGNDSFTSLLLHCDGANGSPSFPDASSHNFTVTAGDAANVNTSAKKFGTASAIFDGADSWLSVADNVALRFGTGDFTVDFWVRFNSLTASVMLFSKGRGDSGPGFLVTSDSGAVHVYAGSGTVNCGSSVAFAADGSFHHVAVVRFGNVWTIYMDGTSRGTQTASVNVSDSTHDINVGGDENAVYNDLDGWMDEVRVSKGIARWTASFTPPVAAYS